MTLMIRKMHENDDEIDVLNAFVEPLSQSILSIVEEA